MDRHLVVVPRQEPDVFAAWRKLHVQDGFARFERLYDFTGNRVDDLNADIIRERVFALHPSSIRLRHVP